MTQLAPSLMLRGSSCSICLDCMFTFERSKGSPGRRFDCPTVPPKWLAAKGLTAPLTLELLLARAAAVRVSNEDVNFGNVFQPVCRPTAKVKDTKIKGQVRSSQSP